MHGTSSSAAQLLESFVELTAVRLKVAAVLGHGGETGRAREQALRDLLRSFLPPSLGVTSGFVIDAHGGKSLQQDIIIHFADYHAVFDVGSIPLVPVESVIAVLEVKSSARSKTVVRECYDNLESVKRLDRSNDGNNVNLVDRYPVPVEPELWEHFQFQVFAGVLAMNSPSPKSWLEVTQEWCRNKPRSVWPNFFCGLDNYVGAYDVKHPESPNGAELGPDPTMALTFAAWPPTGESPLAWTVQEILNFVRVAQRIDYAPSAYLSDGQTLASRIRTKPIL